MHASHLVELAASLVLQDQAPRAERAVWVRDGIVRYWKASRCRLDRWALELWRLPSLAAVPQRDPAWSRLERVAEEFLLADVLTRAWSGWIGSIGAEDPLRRWNEVGESIFQAHLELRHRLLTALVNDRFPTSSIDRLDRLRRQAERWTDLLLALIPAPRVIDRLAFSPPRVVQWGREISPPERPATAQRVLEALAQCYPQGRASVAVNPDLNQDVAVAVLWCLGDWLDDRQPVYSGLWHLRLLTAAEVLTALV